MIKAKNIYYRYLNKNMRFIPIIGILVLIYLNSSHPSNSNTIGTASFGIQQIGIYFKEFTHSFDFSDTTKLFTTTVLLITIWTGNKYWLNNFRIIKRNHKLVDKVIFVIMLLVFSVHIKLESIFGQYFDLGIFLLAIYLVVAVTWLLAKIIDTLDLRSDLYCWGLRILGVALILFGWIIVAAGSMSLMNSTLIFNNIFWITGLCIMGLGAFSEYRSFRRHGIFVYMR